LAGGVNIPEMGSGRSSTHTTHTSLTHWAVTISPTNSSDTTQNVFVQTIRVGGENSGITYATNIVIVTTGVMTMRKISSGMTVKGEITQAVYMQMSFSGAVTSTRS